MARPSKNEQEQEQEILRAALEGLEIQKNRIDEQISMVQQRMGQRPARKQAAPSSSGSTSKKAAAEGKQKTARKKRVLSAAARKRIATAQKARWAAYRKQQDGEEG